VVTTPEKSSQKALALDKKNVNEIYCFKKEEEFKELLENLDIENIEINTS